MKTSTLFLTATLVVNVVLAASLVTGLAGRTSSSELGTTETDSPALSKIGKNGPASVDTRSVDPEAWAKLQSSDLPAMLARLRADGFPEAMIRAIMADEVRKQFAPRRVPFNLKNTARPYWEPAGRDPKTAAALSQILKEQNQALKDLMGPDPATTDAARTALRAQFPNLSEDKLASLARAQEDNNEKRSALMEGVINGGTMLASDREKLTALEKSQHADFAKILSPQELEDYDLRTSSTASTLRYQLVGFNATEQEFRTVYQIQHGFEDQMQGFTAPPTQDEMRVRMQAQEQINNQIKAALGDERYADYQRSNDYNYQQTSRLVTRLELPPETANQVYATQQDLQQRARSVQTDRSLSVDDRNAQLATLSAEAQTKVTAVLGARGFEAYKQYGGNWLQQLQPRVITPVVRRVAP